MPIPSSISDLSTTPASNSPLGSEPPTEGDNHIRALAAIVKQVYTAKATISVKDYGCTGDGTGVGDDAGFTAACAAAGGKILEVPDGHYVFTASAASFTVPSNTHLKMAPGALLDFSGATTATRIRVEGSIGSEVALTGDVAALGAVIPVDDASGFAAGDLLLLSSDALVPTDAIGGSTTETIGEFVTVKSISGDDLTINGYLDAAYLTSDSAKVQKITPSEGVVIEGGKILGFGISGADTSTLEIGIGALYARKLTVKDVRIEHCDYNGLRVDQSYDFLIDNCTVLHEERADAGHTAVIQYGVSILGASSLGTVRGQTAINGKHGIAWSENSLDGMGRDVRITDFKIIGTWHAAITTHESNCHFSISNGDIIGCQAGIDIRVRDFSINNVRVRNIPGASSIGDAVALGGDAADGEIIDLKVDGCRYGIRGYNSSFPSGATPENIKIRGGWIRDAAQHGIFIEHTGNANAKKGWTISDLDITDFAGDGIRANGEFDGLNIQNVRTRCASAPTGYGVRLMGTLNTRVRGCDFIGHIPIRLEDDDQGSPLSPRNPILTDNTWDYSTGFVSTDSGSNVVNQNNIEVGASSVTIASGSVTIPAGVRKITIDTESAGATDDLDTILGGNTGDLIVVRAASSARTVVAKDGTGNLRLSADFSLTHIEDSLTLHWTGAVWLEIASVDNTA